MAHLQHEVLHKSKPFLHKNDLSTTGNQRGRRAPIKQPRNCYRLRVIVGMAVIVMMLGDGLGVSLRLEVLLDIGVFLRSLDLIDIERDAQPLRKIAFGDREIPRACRPC
jgi:hypothetical protein